MRYMGRIGRHLIEFGIRDQLKHGLHTCADRECELEKERKSSKNLGRIKKSRCLTDTMHLLNTGRNME